ncbi:MAG: DUF2924 domain-containing protein [Chthoniobacteraceae bacterium]
MTTEETAKIARQIEELNDLTVNQLREKWVDVWNEPCRSRNKDHLRKRIAWRIQVLAYGGLSERALRRVEELADETLLRILPLRKAPALPPGRKTVTGRLASAGTPGLPMPGSVITRNYQGRTLIVTVQDKGFEFEGDIYRSLSAVAKAITGTHWNGRLFFGLTNSKEAA